MVRAEAGGQKTGRRVVLSTQSSANVCPQEVHTQERSDLSMEGLTLLPPLEGESPVTVMCTERDSTHSLVCSDQKMGKEAGFPWMGPPGR